MPRLAQFKEESPCKPDPVILRNLKSDRYVTDECLDGQLIFKKTVFTLRYKWALSGSNRRPTD